VAGIDPVYFDQKIYALYRAVWERWGDDASWVVWRSGEMLLAEIESELHLELDAGPLPAMQRLADYLQRVGHVREIAVRPLSENEWEYEMADPVILPGARRLIDEGAVPAHISTTLMFPLLKRFGLRAEMVGEPDMWADGCAIERATSAYLGGIAAR